MAWQGSSAPLVLVADRLVFLNLACCFLLLLQGRPECCRPAAVVLIRCLSGCSCTLCSPSLLLQGRPKRGRPGNVLPLVARLAALHARQPHSGLELPRRLVLPAGMFVAFWLIVLVGMLLCSACQMCACESAVLYLSASTIPLSHVLNALLLI